MIKRYFYNEISGLIPTKWIDYMTGNPDVESLNPLLQGHFGVSIVDERAVKIILDSPEIQQLIGEAQESYQRERGIRMQALSPGGYDYNDKYF